MDSPTELSDYTLRSFTVQNPDGKEFTIRTAVHHDGDADADRRVRRRAPRRSSTKRRRSSASFRRSTPAPTRSSATTCRGAAATAWSIATARSSRRATSFKNPQAVRARARHRVARVLPLLERRADPPEDARAVQLRRGEHLGRAVAGRRVHAVLRPADHGARRACRRAIRCGLVRNALAVINSPARQFRSAVEMSQMAPFSDAARRHRRDEPADDVHLVLHLRRGDRGGAGSEPARPIERQDHARRLHARDVDRARQARRPEPGHHRQAVHAEGRARSAGGSVGRSRIRRRVLRQVHRGARAAGLRDASSRVSVWCSASATPALHGPGARSE